ncbi:MAG: anti-sigma factor domain-containing protein [Planctomycetia bacterium]
MKHRLRHLPRDERESELFELMYERAMHGLAPEAEREFERRAAQHPDLDVDCYERAAAALWLESSDGRVQSMPADLKARIASSASIPRPAAAPRAAATPAATRMPNAAAARAGWFAWSGWAAAALLLALLMVRGGEPGAEATSPAELRAALVAGDPAAATLAWSATDDPAGRGVSGDIVWSDAGQAGCMRLRGLPRNDPSSSQYQLWIFDAARPDATPVDGGVFDIAVDGEVLVPVKPRLKVDRATLFAVTAEPAGGVVVSSREHIVALAKR